MCLALPGKIIEITRADADIREGVVDFGGIRKSVNLTYVPDANPGDYVTVHVGFALSKMDEAEAKTVLDHIRQIQDQNQRRLDETAKRFSRS